MWKFLAGLVSGAAIAAIWFASWRSLPPVETSPPSQAERANAVPPTHGARPADVVAPKVERASVDEGYATAPASTPTPRAGPGRHAGPLDIPGGKLGVRIEDPQALDELLEAMRIDCQFGPGAGGNWQQGKLFPHTAAWQGGPIVFDMVDVLGGEARMKNDSGLLGTLDGELDVKLLATDAGMHFTVIKPDGELMVVTVYPSRDVDRRYMAAVSFHGPRLSHETAQFYGSCTRF